MSRLLSFRYESQTTIIIICFPYTHTHTYTNIHRHKSPFYSIRRLNILIGYCRQNIEHEPLEQEGVEEEE